MEIISCSTGSPGSHIPAGMGHCSLCWDHCSHGSSQYLPGTWYWFLASQHTGAPTLLYSYSACLGKLEVFLQLPQAAFVLRKPPPSLFSPWQHLLRAIGRIEPFLTSVLSTQVRTSAPLSAPKLLLAAPWVPLPLPPVPAPARGEHSQSDPQRGQQSFASCFLLDLP